MKRITIIGGVILILIFSNLLSITSADSIIIKDKNNVNNNPILQFYFDKQGWMLYLENIGDEIAYNITISIQYFTDKNTTLQTK